MGWEAIKKEKTPKKHGWPYKAGWCLYFPQLGFIGFFHTLKELKEYVREVNERVRKGPDYLFKEFLSEHDSKKWGGNMFSLHDYGASLQDQDELLPDSGSEE